MPKPNPNKDPADMQRNGESNGRSLLTKHQVISIYTDPRTHTVIADDYHVTRGTITGIKLGNRWGWLICEIDHGLPI